MQTSARKRINLLPGAFLSPELCDRAIANSIANYGRAGTLRRRSSKKFNTKRSLFRRFGFTGPGCLKHRRAPPIGVHVELFIAEEQHHSGILGRFLDREKIPRLSNHWLDSVFRRLRKLAGLDVCSMVLVTAEVLAIPFYQAMRDATRSRLLRSICLCILCDEAAHLNYQALTLGLVRHRLGSKTRAIRFLCHSTLFHCTALLLWQQHRGVFRAAGWDFRRFWNQARRGFARLQRRISQFSRDE